jgi:Tfp pilus assembly protein PilO
VDANGNPVVPPSLTVPPVPAGLQTVNVTVDATGNYSAIEQMISSIYHSLRIINVQKITISTYQGNGGTQINLSSTDPELNLQLQLLTYYSK